MKILVVDDERECAVLLSRLLARLGHDPLIAGDAAEALDLLDDEVAAVITDIDMPGMSGVDLARAIRARRGSIPIAFCTGSDLDSEVASSASRLGPVWPKARSLAMVGQVMGELGLAENPGSLSPK
jgi:CheY-like chemotaxis protein